MNTLSTIPQIRLTESLENRIKQFFATLKKKLHEKNKICSGQLNNMTYFAEFFNKRLFKPTNICL